MKNSKSGYSISIKGFLPGLTYMPAETPLHRLHPLIKLELLICYGLLVFALPHYLPGLCLFILLLVAYRATGMGLNFFWRKLRFIIIFGSLIFFVHLIFVHKGVLLWQSSLLGLSLEIWSVGLTDGLSLLFRFVNIISSSYLFVVTTDPNGLAYSHCLSFLEIDLLPLHHLDLARD
jgi:energy-coupling factor transport system permease protein